MKKDAFIEGMSARHSGIRMSDNPYSRDSETNNFCMWIRGFNCNCAK